MSEFASLRLYQRILGINILIVGIFGVIVSVSTANIDRFRGFDFLTFVVGILLTAAAILGYLVIIDVITLLLEVHENGIGLRMELERSNKSQQEILRQLQALSRHLDVPIEKKPAASASLSYKASTPTPARVAPLSYTPPAVSAVIAAGPARAQVPARVKIDNARLYAATNGNSATDVGGAPLSVIRGQGIYLTARSSDGQWYRFSPDRVSDAWIRAQDLQIADVDKAESLEAIG